MKFKIISPKIQDYLNINLERKCVFDQHTHKATLVL
jgi:hypothetical protein